MVGTYIGISPNGDIVGVDTVKGVWVIAKPVYSPSSMERWNYYYQVSSNIRWSRLDNGIGADTEADGISQVQTILERLSNNRTTPV